MPFGRATSVTIAARTGGLRLAAAPAMRTAGTPYLSFTTSGLRGHGVDDGVGLISL